MSRKRRNKDNKAAPFVALFWEVLNSPAYKALRFASRAALPYFMGKFKGKLQDPCRFDTVFHFPYSEAERYAFSRGTFSRVINDLIAIGFIDPVDKGGLRGTGKSYNYFKLSRRWETYGTEKFIRLNWRCFVPKPRLKASIKMELYKSKNENEINSEVNDISKNESVEVI